MYIKMKKTLILGIETSCDETAAAVTADGREVLSNIISSQIDIHKRYGGVVPEIASRNHTAAINGVVNEALRAAGIGFKALDYIAVTYGAGLLGALVVGVSYAKTLAYSLGIPLVAVSHVRGHIAANYIVHDDIKFPYICLLASGGHTAVLRVDGYRDIVSLGTTVDDAAGEAFDKVARILGLPYPGGPEIERLSESGSASIILPRPFAHESHLNFSFSGIKTAVVNYVNTMKQKGLEINKADVAASFQQHTANIMADNAVRAAKEHGISEIYVAGGVGANKVLRETMSKKCVENSIKAFFLPLKLCTDNAAMIAAEAYYNTRNGGEAADIYLDAKATLDL